MSYLAVSQSSPLSSLEQIGGGLNIGGTPGVSVSGVTFTLVGWFRVTNNTGSDFATIYSEGAAGNTGLLTISMKNTATKGQLKFFYRPSGASTSFTLTSAAAYDDGAWHWYVAQRVLDNSHSLTVDGTAIVSNATSVTTTYLAGTGEIRWGNSLQPGSHIGPHWGFRTVLTTAETKLIAFGGMPVSGSSTTPYLIPAFVNLCNRSDRMDGGYAISPFAGDVSLQVSPMNPYPLDSATLLGRVARGTRARSRMYAVRQAVNRASTY